MNRDDSLVRRDILDDVGDWRPGLPLRIDENRIDIGRVAGAIGKLEFHIRVPTALGSTEIDRAGSSRRKLGYRVRCIHHLDRRNRFHAGLRVPSLERDCVRSVVTVGAAAPFGRCLVGSCNQQQHIRGTGLVMS